MLIGTYLEKQTSHVFMTGGGFANWSKAPSKLGPYTHTSWEKWELSTSMFAFHRAGSQILEETCLYGRRFTPQRGRGKIYNCKFSEVTALRKGMSGTSSQGLAETN